MQVYIGECTTALALVDAMVFHHAFVMFNGGRCPDDVAFLGDFHAVDCLVVAVSDTADQKFKQFVPHCLQEPLRCIPAASDEKYHGSSWSLSFFP